MPHETHKVGWKSREDNPSSTRHKRNKLFRAFTNDKFSLGLAARAIFVANFLYLAYAIEWVVYTVVNAWRSKVIYSVKFTQKYTPGEENKSRPKSTV